MALVDRGQIRQLLLNVLLNAIEAMPQGGVVEVALRGQRRDPDCPATAAAGVGGSWISITVADGGGGIPEDLLPRVFEPFVTTKETGTGLGLSICSRIATAHGGRLSARNRPAGGAEVELLLPAAPAA